MMQIHDRINALTDRAALLNLSLWRVCKLAGVDFSTVARWRNHECNPTIVRFAEITTKVERQIEHLEYEMALKLVGRINPAAAPRIAELLRTPNAGGGGASSPHADSVTAGETAERETTTKLPDADGIRRSGPDRAA